MGERVVDIARGQPRLVPDAVLLDPRNQYSLLYFSQEDYLHAMRGLDAAQIEAAVQHRLRIWSPDALNHALNHLYRRIVRALALAASTGDAAPPGHFAWLIHILTRVAGEGRFDHVALRDLLVDALHAEARLIAELEDAAGEDEDRALHEETARVLGRMLAEHGRPEFSGALPYVDLDRVYYLKPAGPELIEGRRVRFEPHLAWRGGLIAPYRARDLERLEDGGRTIVRYYFERGEFLRVLAELTPAQQDVEFRERPQVHDRDGYLNGLRIAQIVLLQELQRIHGEAASALGERARRAIDAQQHLFARTGTKSPEELAAAESSCIEDARFFAAESRRAGRTSLASRFDSLLPLLEHARAELDGE